MEVRLIDYTGHGHSDPARHAANVLLFTKQTRLNMTAGLMEDIASWPEDKVNEELAYMANTIPSSWEFVEYKFLINGVTRGFTHQFVRTRTGSYAQQTMRVLDVSGWGYGTGPTIETDEDRKQRYDDAMHTIAEAYDELVADGAAIEDARGILPTNILTNIVAKFDLRTISDTARKRASTRTQGEYRLVMDAMKSEIIRVHPWADMFLNRTFDKAAAELESRITAICNGHRIPDTMRINLIKLIDQMRATA